NATLPWFWSLDIQGDSAQDTTVYRIHWLHTKALCNRWAEELIPIEHEMGWTLEFFLFKA
ncbi:hypothetical protein BDR06DRAFT_832909, partial [Suillus hirtellus]